MGAVHTIGLEAAWLAALGTLELRFAAWPRRGAAGRRRARNLTFTVVNHAVIPPVGLLCAHLLAGAGPGAGLGPAVPPLLGVPVAIMTLDLIAYGVHRLVHRSRLLWRFHQIHHLDEDFDVTTGVRVHTVESALHQVVMVGVATLAGIPAGYLAVYATVAFALDLFHHCNIAIPHRLEKALRGVIITPALHVVHHHDRRDDTDSNFGFVFSWWDRMFGTYNPRTHTADRRLGLDYSADLGIADLLTRPFRPTPLRAATVPPRLRVVAPASSAAPPTAPAHRDAA